MSRANQDNLNFISRPEMFLDYLFRKKKVILYFVQRFERGEK